MIRELQSKRDAAVLGSRRLTLREEDILRRNMGESEQAQRRPKKKPKPTRGRGPSYADAHDEILAWAKAQAKAEARPD